LALRAEVDDGCFRPDWLSEFHSFIVSVIVARAGLIQGMSE